MRRANLNEPVLTSKRQFLSDPRLPRAELDDLLGDPLLARGRERVMSSSSFFETLLFYSHPLACHVDNKVVLSRRCRGHVSAELRQVLEH
jgi:hypothetical protein